MLCHLSPLTLVFTSSEFGKRPLGLKHLHHLEMDAGGMVAKGVLLERASPWVPLSRFILPFSAELSGTCPIGDQAILLCSNEFVGQWLMMSCS